MTPELLVSELERFNALSPEEAKVILETAQKEERPDLRSCWYCNDAHERLKSRELLLCFACGHYYMQSYPAAAVQRRAAGILITQEEMNEFNEGLESAA